MSFPETPATEPIKSSAEEPSLWLWAAMLVSLVALAALALLVILLLADQVGRRSLIGLLGALVLGGLLAFSAIQSARRPAVPDYSQPLDEDMCRKPKAP